MAGSTPIYGFPYPQPSDLVANYPALGQDLAEDVEDVIAAVVKSAQAVVDTYQTTNSTSYTDLATVGPSVTITTGARALVIVSAEMSGDASTSVKASFEVTGASAFGAEDQNALFLFTTATPGIPQTRSSVVNLLTGLTPGSNTFTMKYKRPSGSNAAFQYRRITVVALGA